MDRKEARLDCGRRSCSSDLPAVKKEPMDEEEDGVMYSEDQSRIADLIRQLAESELRAKVAEEERDKCGEQMMQWMETETERARQEQLLQAARSESVAIAERAELERNLADAREKWQSNEKLLTAAVAENRRLGEELEKFKTNVDMSWRGWDRMMRELQSDRSRLDELLVKERREREEERKEMDTGERRTRKFVEQLMSENDDLKDRMKELTDRMGRSRQFDRNEQRVMEERRETERKMERLETIRGEMSKVLADSASVHARLEAERDEMRERARVAEEERQRSSIELASLRVRCDLLEKENKGMAQRVREEEERGKEAKRRMKEMERESHDAAAKQREELARVEGEMEEIRGINTFLVKTKAGELFEEVLEARERIRELEKEMAQSRIKKEEGDDELRRKRARRDTEKMELEEVEEGEIKDELDSSALPSSNSEVSSHSDPSLQEKITVASSITTKIALAPKYRSPAP